METKTSDYASFSQKMQAFGLKKIISYLEENPEENVEKALNLFMKFDTKGGIMPQATAIAKGIVDKENNWNQLIMKFFKDINPTQRRKAIENFVVNATLYGRNRSRELSEKYDCNIPWVILMDPTSACNLHCTGCWAADYGNKLNLTFDELDNVIVQGKELGIFMYIFSGGEPLVRKKDILALCEKHSDCFFLAFTNGTLIDEAFADEVARLGNFVPAISIEGFEDETDFRRGKGTYKAAVKALEIMNSRNLISGISCCYTSKNAQTIGSEEFIDDMISKGAYFAWFFTYIPIGQGAVTELMATPEQRKYMYSQIRKFRTTKPLFTMDFWNDGEYVNGCIAAGKGYLHINANGDIEPCAFIHYSDSNIREKTLLEAFMAPLFKRYRKGQPFNGNMLRPCPLLDNPEKLEAVVTESGAQSTDLQYRENVHDLCAKCRPAAERWAKTADEIWKSTE